jgi:hypothetical protein
MKITNDSCCAQEITSSGGSSGDTVLNITGNPTIASNTITTIDVTGDSNISSNIITSLVVTGTTYITGPVEQPVLSIIGDAYVSNAFTTRDAYVSNALTADSVDITGALTAGSADITGTLTAAGAEITGTLIAGGSVQTTDAVVSGLLVSENIRVSNLSVTGNFYVTATNTTTTNSFTIDNTGTTTALIVRQTEPTVHTHNVAEFYDATTPALIIDPEGNLAVHTTVSPNYAMTLVDGASFDVLTIRGSGQKTSLGVTGNIYASNALTTGRVFVTGTAGQTSLAVSGNIYASNALTTTNVYAATQVLTGSAGQTSLDVTGNVYASNAVTTGCVFVTGSAGQTSLDVTGNVYASNAVTTTNVIASSVQLASSTYTVPSGTLQFNSTAGIYNATIGSIRGIIPTRYMYVLNSDRAMVNLAQNVLNPMLPPINGITNLANGKYYIRIEHSVSITTATSGATNYLAAAYTGSATYTLDVMSLSLRNGALLPVRNTAQSTVIPVTTILLPNTSFTYMFVYTGVINVTTPGSISFNFLSINSSSLPLQTGTIFAGSSILLQPLGVTGADVVIGNWS